MNKETFDSLHKHGVEHTHVQIPPCEGGENRKKKLEGLKDKRCREDAKAQQLLRLIERRRIGYLACLGNINVLDQPPDLVEAAVARMVLKNFGQEDRLKVMLGTSNCISISPDKICCEEGNQIHHWWGSADSVLFLHKLRQVVGLIKSCCVEGNNRDFLPLEIEWVQHENQEKHGTRITPRDCSPISVLLLESTYPELVGQPSSQQVVRIDQVLTKDNFSIADVLLAPAYFGLLHVDGSRMDKAQNDIFLKRCTWKSCSQVFQANNRNEKYCSSCKCVAKKERNDESRAESRLKKKNETYHDLAKELKRSRYFDGKLHHIDKISRSLNCSTASLYQRFSCNKDDYWIRQNIRIQKHNKHEYSFHIEPRN